MLNEMWDKTDSGVITENVVKLLAEDGYNTFTERWKRLMDITGSTKHAVYAWLNRGRTDIKIPFLKLCLIADTYNIEVSKLIGGNYIMEKKYAITRTVGNNEEVLKVFGSDKQAALAYGAEVAKDNSEGVIACVYALFNEEGKMFGGNCRVFEVWS